MSKSNDCYVDTMEQCRELFIQKMEDYGQAWRILRPSSLTDQIFIKAKRIRSIQEKHVNKVGDSIEGEFIAMVNYGLMAIIQLNIHSTIKIDNHRVQTLYDSAFKKTNVLFQKKNHDYGEAWRDMRISSMTDLILMKLLRIKQIEDNDGKTTVSEGVYSGYQDIINYSIFCLILMSEKKIKKYSKKQLV